MGFIKKIRHALQRSSLRKEKSGKKSDDSKTFKEAQIFDQKKLKMSDLWAVEGLFPEI
jgi:hypothetical protein